MLPAPRLNLSSRIAAGILVTIVVSTVVALAVPQMLPRVVKDVICGAGFILGLPLFVLLINDLANLRREQLVARHASEPVREAADALAPPRNAQGPSDDADEDEDEGDDYGDDDDDVAYDLVIDADGVSAELVARWRSWRWWLLGIVALTIATKLVFGPVWMGVAIYVLAPAVLRELYLVLNALEAMTPGVWAGVRPWERALARLYPALLGLGMVGALLTWIGALVYAATTATWTAALVVQAAGATLLSGWLLLLMAGAAWQMLRLAWRRGPPAADDEGIPAAPV